MFGSVPIKSTDVDILKVFDAMQFLVLTEREGETIAEFCAKNVRPILFSSSCFLRTETDAAVCNAESKVSVIRLVVVLTRCN